MKTYSLELISNDSPFARCAKLILSELYSAIENSEGPINIKTEHKNETEWNVLSDAIFDKQKLIDALKLKAQLSRNIPLAKDSENLSKTSKGQQNKRQQLFNIKDVSELSESEIIELANGAESDWNSLKRKLAVSYQDKEVSLHKKRMEQTRDALCRFGFILHVNEVGYEITQDGIQLYKSIENKWTSFGEDDAHSFNSLKLAVGFFSEVRGNALWDLMKGASAFVIGI